MTTTHFAPLGGLQSVSKIAVGLVCAVLNLTHIPLAFAQTQTEPQAAESYTAPVKVLQNRYFLKGMRPELSLFGGTVLNESYSRTSAFGARAAMFVTEALGLEYSYIKYNAQDSNDLKALKADPVCVGNICTHKEPVFTRLNGSHDFTGVFAPIYGKINLLDWTIVYSDIYVSAGAGALSSSQGSKTAGVFGAGQRFYFAKNYSVRLDATDHLFKEVVETPAGSKESWKHSWTVTVGFSAFLYDFSEGSEP